MNRLIEEYSKNVTDLQKENEKLLLQVKDLQWQLEKLKETTEDRKREMADELSKIKSQAQASQLTNES